MRKPSIFPNRLSDPIVRSSSRSALADDFDDADFEEHSPAQPQADLRELFLILFRRRLFILGATTATLTLALLYLLITPSVYTATVSILIDQRPAAQAGADTTAAPLGTPDATQVESQVRLIASDAILRRVVQSEHLGDDPEFAPPARPGLRARLLALLGVGSKPQADDNTTRALIALARAVVVRHSERTYVIDVDVTSRDPIKAARLANDVASAYIDDQRDEQVQRAQRDAADLDQRIATLQTKVQQADTAVTQFKSAHQIIDANGKNIGEQELSDLATELAKARANAVDTKSKYDQIQKAVAGGGSPDAIADVAKSTTLDRLRQQYADIVKQEANLKTTLGSRHPALLEVESQLRDTQGLINQELRRIAASTKSDYLVAIASEAETTQRLEAARKAVDTTNQSLVALNQLQQTADANHAVYDKYLRARKSIDDNSITASNGRVIAPAIVPTAASAPKRLATLAIALFGGLFFGAGIALLRDYLAGIAPPAAPVVDDEALASGADVRRIESAARSDELALHVIASVPRIKHRSLPTGLFPSMRDWMLRPRAEEPAAAGAVSILDEFAVHPDSPFSKSILALLEALARQERGPRDTRTVLITSADEGIGKTTIAANLARAAMAKGKAALLIDGNPANPSLSELLQPGQKPGLIELAGTTRVIYPIFDDGESSLHVVPLLAAEERIVARLMRRPSTERFDGITDNFDFVIIDGPTLSAGDEARIAARAVDCIVVVTAAPNHDDLSLDDILDELDVPARKFGGAVLSMVDGEKAA
jgi:succinoglycan biosynthesis transport protein ExoP